MSIELTTISEELARDILMQLLNLGVYSSIYQSEREIILLPDGNGGMKEYKVQNKYKISIQDRSSRD